jgi:hypothetical protein
MPGDGGHLEAMRLLRLLLPPEFREPLIGINLVYR